MLFTVPLIAAVATAAAHASNAAAGGPPMPKWPEQTAARAASDTAFCYSALLWFALLGGFGGGNACD